MFNFMNLTQLLFRMLFVRGSPISWWALYRFDGDHSHQNNRTMQSCKCSALGHICYSQSHTYTHTLACTHMHIHKHARTYTQTHRHTHRDTHTDTETHTHTDTHRHTHTRTHTHICIRMYIHTYTSYTSFKNYIKCLHYTIYTH